MLAGILFIHFLPRDICLTQGEIYNFSTFMLPISVMNEPRFNKKTVTCLT